MNTEEKKEPASILRERTKVVKTVRRKPNKGEDGKDLFVETVKVSKVIDLNPDKKKEYRELKNKIADARLDNMFINFRIEAAIKELVEKQKEINDIKAKCSNKFIDEAEERLDDVYFFFYDFIEANIKQFEEYKKLLDSM